MDVAVRILDDLAPRHRRKAWAPRARSAALTREEDERTDASLAVLEQVANAGAAVPALWRLEVL
jgi:hypothetical protein